MKLKDKLNNVSINIQQFYTLGIVCFLIVAIAGVYTGIVTWKFLDIGSKVSTIFRGIFNFGLVLFFNHLRTESSPTKKKEKEIDIEDLIEKSGL